MPLWCLEIGHKGENVSYKEIKEAEQSIKKMKMLETLGKTSFLTTRQYEKLGEFFNATRTITKVFSLQRRSPSLHKSKRNIETSLNHFSIYPDDFRNNQIVISIEQLVKGYVGVQAKIR